MKSKCAFTLNLGHKLIKFFTCNQSTQSCTMYVVLKERNSNWKKVYMYNIKKIKIWTRKYLFDLFLSWTSCPQRGIRSGWGKKDVYSIKQYQIVLPFEDSLFILLIQSWKSIMTAVFLPCFSCFLHFKFLPQIDIVHCQSQCFWLFF